ncbi:glycosyltransferase family 2 protein [Candidatus Dependentiae bacterium]
MSISSSVIVCTRNRPADVVNFLDSLKKQTEKPNEVIIVDSSDEEIYKNPIFFESFSSKHFPKTKLIYKHTAPGLTYQRNIGAKAASCQVIHFFDDDVILEKNYLQQMNHVFAQNPQYAGGMGDITNIPKKKRSFNTILRNLFMLQRIYSSGKFTLSGMPKHPYGTNTFKQVEVLGGCVMAYRSWVFKKHFFDEKLKKYCYMEDCDFSRRISYEHPLFYNPKAKLKHLHSPVSRDRIEENKAMYIKNYSYLFFKNFYPKNRLKIFAYTWSILGLFAEGILYRNKAYLKGYFKGLKNFFSSR